MRVLGSVAELWRYPVKSMMGELCQKMVVSYAGANGDRCFAFTRHDSRLGTSWLTARTLSSLILYRPCFTASDLLETECSEFYALQVTNPEGHIYSVHAPELLSELEAIAGHKLRLKFSERGMHDARPLSLISNNTTSQIELSLGGKIDKRRFRANLYVQWNDSMSENDLLGTKIRIGNKLELYISKKDTRCLIVDINPGTGIKDPGVLRTIATEYENCAGVYCVVLREGTVQPGDTIVAL